jgi:hypothetical protein
MAGALALSSQKRLLSRALKEKKSLKTRFQAEAKKKKKRKS